MPPGDVLQSNLRFPKDLELPDDQKLGMETENLKQARNDAGLPKCNASDSFSGAGRHHMQIITLARQRIALLSGSRNLGCRTLFGKLTSHKERQLRNR